MKIKSIKSVGYQNTYSPEMSSDHHNYITQESSAVHANSHGVSYCLMSLRCLFLKAHFAPEWWAAVMSGCHPDKLVRYMGVARSEPWEPTHITNSGIVHPFEGKGVKFGTINISNLSYNYSVSGNIINQGLIGIKGIGENAAKKFAGRGEYKSLDEFVEAKGKDKTVLEIFIKLGAFKHLPNHSHTKALWNYYLFVYGTGKDVTALRKKVKDEIVLDSGWDDKAIAAEIKRQTDEYLKAYPKRNKIPKTIQSWKPKPDLSFESVIKVLSKEPDYTLKEILQFEKQYLGYYLHSPLDVYHVSGNCTISDAKEIAASGGQPRLEGVIVDVNSALTSGGKDYLRILMSDGVREALIFVWNTELRNQNLEILEPGVGIQMDVDYDESRNTFTLARGETILRLWEKEEF